MDGILLGNLSSAESLLFVVILTMCIHDGLAALWIFLVNLRNGKTRQYLKCICSRRFIKVALCALLGGVIGMTLNVAAIHLAGASFACAITSAYPAAGAVIGIIFLKERCNSRLMSGIILVAAGAIIIGIAPAAGMCGSDLGMGLAVAVMAMLCWALEGIFSKSAMEDISSDVLIGIREMVSFMAYMVILFFMADTGESALQGVFHSDDFTMLAAASVFGAFSFLFWYRSMDMKGVAVGMSLNATYALWAVVFDVIVNGKSFSFAAFAGAAVIMAGTVLTVLSGQKKEIKGVIRTV